MNAVNSFEKTQEALFERVGSRKKTMDELDAEVTSGLEGGLLIDELASAMERSRQNVRDVRTAAHVMSLSGVQLIRAAETILAHWEEPADLTDYGNIIEVQRVQMRSGLSGFGRLRTALTALLEREFSARALLILKSFPLEYEGDVTDQNREAFEKRRAAMMRHYRTMLGVHALPGRSGAEGWMFSIPARLSESVEPPTEIIDREW